MEYSNPEIPEGINTSREHPLKELLLLVSAAVGIIFLVVAGLTFLAEYLAGYIPFSSEQKLAALYPVESRYESAQQRQAGERITTYLQQLAEQLARAEELPNEMRITLHYIDDDTVNAFATLGGHVVFFRGLLEKIPDENTLAMVMAHEIAHIKFRHPIRSLGRGVIVASALAVVSAAAGDNLSASVLQEAGLLTILHYNRRQESEADEVAIAALQTHYGHVAGATGLFRIFLKEEKEAQQLPAFLSTHPLSEERIRRLQQMASQNRWNTADPRPLPAEFGNWLQAGRASL